MINVNVVFRIAGVFNVVLFIFDRFNFLYKHEHYHGISFGLKIWFTRLIYLAHRRELEKKCHQILCTYFKLSEPRNF